MDTTKSRQYSLLAQFNQPHAIKVATHFFKNTQEEFHLSSHDETDEIYDVEMMVKMLPVWKNKKRWYK